MDPAHRRAATDLTVRRLRAALFANAGIVVFQMTVAFFAGSLALLSDAWHNFADLLAVALALSAVRMSRRAPTGTRSFGWHRGRVLAAQANAALILVVTGFLLLAALFRLADPRPVEGGLVLAAAALGFLVNAAAAYGLRQEPDLGARSAALHLAGDAASSLAVAVAGGVMLLVDGVEWIDPLASIAVCALVLVSGWRLLRSTTDVLLEGTPRDVDPDAVTQLIESVPGVESAHDLHVWSLDGALHALSVHVVVAGHPTLEEAQAVGTEVKRTVSAPFSIAHATVELECEGCTDDGSWCAIGEAVPPRLGGHHH